MSSEFQNLPPAAQEAVMRTMDAMEPAQTQEEIREMLEGTQKGGVKNSIKNCLTVFQRDPLLRGAVSYNILSERVDIVKPLGWERTSATLTDMDMKYLLLYLEEHYGLTSEKKVENAIQIVANENRYHPVRDYLNSLQWDGTERIRYALHHFLGADTDEYTFEALKLFMMGAIRRVFQPGSKFEVMLCLVGGQGAGKSTFFRLLAVKDEWFSDDLKKLDDENVYRKLQGHWIMEMSEMIATANARSIEEIKSFLSRQKETYKVPYETHPASQIELRLVAHICADEAMISGFADGADIHTSTAARVFGLPEEMITPEMRSAAKAVNFGIIYGIGAFSLSKDINVSVYEAKKYINDYLHKFPNVEKFMNETVEKAKKDGYVTTMFGRKRYVPELSASNKNMQAAGKRIAMNTPIQGSAADIIKIAMVRVYGRLKKEIPEARLILQVHDELIVECSENDADRAAEILSEEMTHACDVWIRFMQMQRSKL